MSDNNTNYLIQSNYFTRSVLKDIKEIQKDIIYFVQSIIDYQDDNADGSVVFDYNEFLKFKKIDAKRNTYSLAELTGFLNDLKKINGVFFDKQANETVFFNLIDNVRVSNENPYQFIIEFAKFGKVFFFKKFALQYANQHNIGYTQIEKNIIDLDGHKRKKFFELLSQFKETGLFRISLEDFKITLGFIEYKYINDKGEQVLLSDEIEENQLRLLFNYGEHEGYEKVEYFKDWRNFRRVFLEPSIKEFNSNTNLDIHNIVYETKKVGNKIVGLEFRFKKRLKDCNLSEKEKTGLKYFTDIGLSEKQVVYLLQRLSIEEMYTRFNQYCTFNRNYDKKDSPFFRRKIWFDREGVEIKNLGGYLYEKVFPELNNKN